MLSNTCLKGEILTYVKRIKSVSFNLGFAYGSEVDFCGSRLEIEASDIKKKEWSKYPCFKGTDYGVRCPVCGKFVVIDENKIPASIRDKAEYDYKGNK